MAVKANEGTSRWIDRMVIEVKGSNVSLRRVVRRTTEG